jgi:BolA protein
MQKIRVALERALAPVSLEIRDDSHLHAGHAGARSGKGHFSVVIVAAGFEGRSLLECHRMVYGALGELMDTDIHALSIRASAPAAP